VIAQAGTAVDPTSNPLFIPALSDAEDADGTIYLAWQDCRFRADCSANDVVMTTSSDGITWSPVRRVTRDTGDNTRRSDRARRRRACRHGCPRHQ
jgi:hypothetical protein